MKESIKSMQHRVRMIKEKLSSDDNSNKQELLVLVDELDESISTLIEDVSTIEGSISSINQTLSFLLLNGNLNIPDGMVYFKKQNESEDTDGDLRLRMTNTGLVPERFITEWEAATA